MRIFIQLAIGAACSLSAVVVLVLMAISEINFMDQKFCTYFGILVTLGAVVFFVLTRNDDNEETNPSKEKVKR